MEQYPENFINPRKLDWFENRTKRWQSQRYELYTVKMELSHQGLSCNISREPAVSTNKLFILPSTHLRHWDLLVPRNKQFTRGKRIYLEVMCFKEDIELAKDAGKDALLIQLEREKADLKIMEKNLKMAKI